MSFLDACARGNIKVVQSLVSNVTERKIHIGLSVACRNGHTNIVKLIIKTGLINKYDDALISALVSYHRDIISLLLETSESENKIIDINDGLYFACKHQLFFGIIRQFIEYGTKNNVKIDWCRVFRMACVSGNIYVIRLLMDGGKRSTEMINEGLKASLNQCNYYMALFLCYNGKIYEYNLFAYVMFLPYNPILSIKILDRHIKYDNSTIIKFKMRYIIMRRMMIKYHLFLLLKSTFPGYLIHCVVAPFVSHE